MVKLFASAAQCLQFFFNFENLYNKMLKKNIQSNIGKCLFALNPKGGHNFPMIMDATQKEVCAK